MRERAVELDRRREDVRRFDRNVKCALDDCAIKTAIKNEHKRFKNCTQPPLKKRAKKTLKLLYRHELQLDGRENKRSGNLS